MLFNFYLYQEFPLNKVLIQKIFTKYLYTKFLIIANFNILKYKSVLILDNYFIEFSFKQKKKIKRLNFLCQLKTGKFFKGNLFLYRHSKLPLIYFFSISFYTYIKKKIFFSFYKLQYLVQELCLVFIYKNVRGGFLGFSNNVLGFFSKKYFLNLKLYLKEGVNLLTYKKYFILINIISCLPYKYTQMPTLINSSFGYSRNFQKIKIKKKLRLFFFKRFKFFFLVPFFILQKKIFYIKKNFLYLLSYKSFIFFSFIFNFFLSFLFLNKKKLIVNK